MSWLKKNKKNILILSVVILIFGFCYRSTSSKNFELVIFYVNDTHGYVEHEPYLKALADKEKSEGKNVLIISAGDVVQGELIANLTKGSVIFEIMNAVGYDYLVPGNHEFAYGVNKLLELEKSAKFKILAANIKNKNKNLFKPSDLIEINGIKIGIFGITTPETKTKSGGDGVDKLEFIDPVEASKEIIKKLKSQGARIIIAVTHLGLDNSSLESDRSDNLIRKLNGEIDLLIDGHSHTELPEGLKIDESLIVQTGEYGNNIGVAKLSLNKKELEIKKETYLISRDEYKKIAPDQKVLEIINREEKKVEEMTQEKICEINFVLDGEREQIRNHETNLSDLITDAMRLNTGADIALINGGTIRSSIQAGEVTRGDILRALPFSNELFTGYIKGKKILEALEYSFAQYENSPDWTSSSLLHVSGLNFKVNLDQKAGNRISDVYLIKNMQELDPEQEYILAAEKYLFDGGDGYDMLSDNKYRASHGLSEDNLINYMRNLDSLEIYKTVQDRVQIKNINQEYKAS